MEDSQGSSVKKILPITSVNQLCSSYLVAQIIVEIRKDLEEETDTKALEVIPELTVPVPKRLEDLYIEAAKIVKYKPVILYLLKYSIEDMVNYNFSEDPSVVIAASNDTSHLQQTFGSSFSTLAKVNLMEHSINVFEEAVKVAKNKGRAAGVIIPMIAALLHDFGKSNGIRTELIGEASARGYKAHAQVSASYIRDILQIKVYNKLKEIPEDTIDLLADIVTNHHPQNGKTKADPGVNLVIEADHAARKKEYQQLIKQKANKESK